MTADAGQVLGIVEEMQGGIPGENAFVDADAQLFHAVGKIGFQQGRAVHERAVLDHGQTVVERHVGYVHAAPESKPAQRFQISGLDELRQTGAALATPSANPSGAKSPVDASEVLAYFDGRIHGIVDGGRCKVGVASTIVDLTRDHPVILRQGGLSEDAIFAVLEKNGGRA